MLFGLRRRRGLDLALRGIRGDGDAIPHLAVHLNGNLDDVFAGGGLVERGPALLVHRVRQGDLRGP